MAKETLDLRGLKCPVPILKIGAKVPSLAKGDLIEVVADCNSFEADLRRWCQRLSKPLLWLRKEDEKTVRAQIQL